MLHSIGSKSLGTVAHCQSGSLVQCLAEADGKVAAGEAEEAGEALVDVGAGDGAATAGLEKEEDEAGEALVGDDAGDPAATAEVVEVDDMVLIEEGRTEDN